MILTAYECGRLLRLAGIFGRWTYAKFFAAIEKTSDLLVPTISIYEVFKRALQQRDETAGLQAVALMHQGTVVELTATLTIDSARLSRELALPMADSIMLATAAVTMRRFGLKTRISQR